MSRPGVPCGIGEKFLVHLLEISIGPVMVVRDMSVPFRRLYPCAGIGLGEIGSTLINIVGEESVGFEELCRDPCLVKGVLLACIGTVSQFRTIGCRLRRSVGQHPQGTRSGDLLLSSQPRRFDAMYQFPRSTGSLLWIIAEARPAEPSADKAFERKRRKFQTFEDKETDTIFSVAPDPTTL
jgi:hypothetical protein